MTPTRIEVGDLVTVKLTGESGQVTHELDAEFGQWIIIRTTAGYLEQHSDNVEVLVDD